MTQSIQPHTTVSALIKINLNANFPIIPISKRKKEIIVIFFIVREIIVT